MMQFQAIADRNSQLFFLRKHAAFECRFNVNGKKLASISKINVGHVKKLLHAARKRNDRGETDTL
jgi:hypothetical protein